MDPPGLEETFDVASLNSEDLKVPLPGDIGQDPYSEYDVNNLFDTGEASGTDEYVDAPEMRHSEKEEVVEPLSSDEKRNLKSMIEDSCLSTQPVFKFKMPWERPGLRTVFERKPRNLIPTPVLQPVDITDLHRVAERAVPLPSEIVKRGAFSEVIRFDINLSEQEVEDKLSRQALEKWYLIFASGEEAWPMGFNLRNAIAEHKLEDMKLIFGNKSPNTLIRRGSSMLQFIKWYKTKYFSLCPFPLSTELVEEYVTHLSSEKKSSSSMRGFVESINFCQHFLRMNIFLEGLDPFSAKVRRTIEAADAMRPEKRQARVLTVSEVEFLENCLTNDKISLTDRVACGAILFCLYSRSRWSDIRKVYHFVQDVKEHEGKIVGYLECKTRSHKTSRLVAKADLAMPLVAPVWGVASPPWGLMFVKLCQSSDRPLELIQNESMLNAPTPDGKWSSRSVTTTEAGKWLRKLLAGMSHPPDYTSIHSLKATPLSWCAKWGLEPEARTILGHHSTGKTSAECYARDSLAKPLRDFDLVLQQIRMKTFSPDSTRSGMLCASGIEDPSHSYVHPDTSEKEASNLPAPEHQPPESSSSSSTDSLDSDSADSASELENDPVTRARVWDPDIQMYRNKKSLVVHVVAEGGAESFSCEVKITDDFEPIADSNFLDIRRCKRCAAAKPIKTIGQLTSALKKLRTAK